MNAISPRTLAVRELTVEKRVSAALGEMRIEELHRKAEQGSQQLQAEVQELELLRLTGEHG